MCLGLLPCSILLPIIICAFSWLSRPPFFPISRNQHECWIRTNQAPIKREVTDFLVVIISPTSIFHTPTIIFNNRTLLSKEDLTNEGSSLFLKIFFFAILQTQTMDFRVLNLIINWYYLSIENWFLWIKPKSSRASWKSWLLRALKSWIWRVFKQSLNNFSRSSLTWSWLRYWLRTSWGTRTTSISLIIY